VKVKALALIQGFLFKKHVTDITLGSAASSFVLRCIDPVMPRPRGTKETQATAVLCNATAVASGTADKPEAVNRAVWQHTGISLSDTARS
jgi:hypothetical protein